MSRGKYGRHGRRKTRRDYEEKQQKREIVEAKKDLIDDLPVEEVQESESPETQNTDWVADDKRKWYVVDTNLILSCVDVIYDATDPNWRPPLDFRPSLDNAHIIIPKKVFDELNHIKDGFTINRLIARKAFDRLKKFFPNSGRTMREIMTLSQPIRTGWKNQTISILPLHKEFRWSLPWVPDEDDNDGWIAVTALAATMIRDGLPVDGTVPVEDMLRRSNSRRDVILLTNDNPLLTDADEYGVRSKPYSFKERPPFTGMRELVVPAEMFAKFYHDGKLTRGEFEEYMPNEAPLVANEYIVMTPKDDVYPRSYFTSSTPFMNVARYHKADQMLRPMRHMKFEGETPPNAGIATYYDAMNDDSIHVAVVTGKAGTGKTFQIVRHSIKALHDGRYAMVVLIVNSDNGVGYLPGDQDKKLEPMVAFCKDAIRSYLAKTPEFKKKRENLRKFGDSLDIEQPVVYENKKSRKRKRSRKKVNQSEQLTDENYWYMYEGESGGRKGGDISKTVNDKEDNNNSTDQKTYYELLEDQVNYIYKRYFMAIPYKQAQGRCFEDAIVVIDEAQRIIIDEMETFITRLGRNSFLVACGDVNQIRYNSPEKRIKNGLIFTRKVYYDWDGCANIHLTDNMRHEAADIANQNYEKVIDEIGELQT